MDPEKDIIKYYMKGKIDKYIQIENLPKAVNRKSTLYYEYALNNILKNP